MRAKSCGFDAGFKVGLISWFPEVRIMDSGKKTAITLLMALSLFSIVSMSGCTSNKYVPCCVRGSIYQDSGLPFADPKCVFQNGTTYGACILPNDTKSVAFCNNGTTTCASINSEEECTATLDCTWAPGVPNGVCQGGGTGGLAHVPFPVCTDLVPQSCTNNKCTAMVCGYTDIRPAPPPASQDWNSESASNLSPGTLPANMPANDLQLPSIGLQKVTCDFNTMNNKLYNQVKASRGALWVNSFRFGVGSSFSDFESAKNFFPATDRACAANPEAKVDRFTTYLGNYAFCQQSSSYYKCTSPKVSGLYFKDETQCKLFCGGGVSPYSCTLVSGGASKFICNSDGFAYETEDACKDKCSRIDDPNACANNISKFPFLDTDSTGLANYRMKYVSDYMVDTRDPDYNTLKSQTCREVAGPIGQFQFYPWIEGTIQEPNHCNDFYYNPANGWSDGPWYKTFSCYLSTGCDPATTCSSLCPDGNKLGEQRSYFDNHAYSVTDFDYSYYRNALFYQYPPSAAETKLPFECESSSDCLSGSCDTTNYKRPMCSDINGNVVACLCSPKEFGSAHASYPSCYFSGSAGGGPGMYADTGISAEGVGHHIASEVNSGGAMFYPVDSLHNQSKQPTRRFIYYALAPSGTSPQPPIFDLCNVTPARVQKCIMKDKYMVEECEQGGSGCKHTLQITDDKVIWDPDASGVCHYSGEEEPGWSGTSQPQSLYYWKYDLNLAGTAPLSINPLVQANMERLGVCALNGNVADSKAPTPPYLKMKDMGWCAGCSYATLAVQKVGWGQGLPGGVQPTTPRQYACYEYRGESNYIPSKTKPPYGVGVEEYVDSGSQFSSNPLYEGANRFDIYGASPTPSTEPVRYTSNPSAYEFDVHGNIALSWGKDGVNPSYVCEDLWHASGGWWKAAEIPTPSAPYLKEKLTSYLQSSVMPILDEVHEKTNAPAEHACTQWHTGSSYYVCPYEDTTLLLQAACDLYCKGKSVVNSGYNPLFICNTAGGDGAVLHVVGDSSMLSGGAAGDYGSAAPSAMSAGLLTYLDITGTEPFIFNSTPSGGKGAILARTERLKGECKTPPLVGIELLPPENETTLIGDPANGAPGKLYNFFFKQPVNAQRAARGMADKLPDNVDLLMQDWYPMCTVGNPLYPGEREVYEFERRLEFSRALLSNFSKPSLVWKFAFPKDSLCNQTFFLDYLFNNTQEMVDSGITGLIYSDWSTRDGVGYGPETQTYADNAKYTDRLGDFQHNIDNLILKTGLTTIPPSVRGTDQGGTSLGDPTYVLDDKVSGTGKTGLFCALEKYSLRSIGYTALTYGQKLYAENKTCYCTPCTFYDRMMGTCPSGAPNNNQLPQLYCNDGTKCTMPDDRTDYNNYMCEPRCMNYTACMLCSSQPYLASASFCRFTSPGGSTSGYSKPYSEISDDYWEFLAGLSPPEKCCLAGSADGMAGTKYTYVGVSGTKQQSVFLQYPTRGEPNLDCGSAPDTSVLEYCNIKVPISQKEIACMQIDKPPVQIVVGSNE